MFNPDSEPPKSVTSALIKQINAVNSHKTDEQISK